MEDRTTEDLATEGDDDGMPVGASEEIEPHPDATPVPEPDGDVE